MAVRIAAGEAGLPAYDGAYVRIDDPDGYTREARAAQQLGFAGKSCIHPSQIALANAVFRPSAADVDHALRVIEAARDSLDRGVGAFVVDGRLVDGPFITRAENTRRARAAAGPAATPRSVMRDFVGYANRPPHAAWPGEARVAMQFALNYEEGSEASVLDGDGRNELGMTEATGGRVPIGWRDLAFESLYEYGSRVGVWRVLDQFRDRELPLTVFGCAVALERNPAVAQAIREAGYDVCCHGWRWVEPFRLAEDEEREHIAKAVASITATTGERPLGWYCRYGAGENTRRLLVEEGGFLYDSDAYNDELPYWVQRSRSRASDRPLHDGRE